MKTELQLVDRGRGLQLSTSRITVQDLVPYFQAGDSYDEIMRWIPVLKHEEIALVDRYYKEHKEELDEIERQIDERIAQRKNPPEIEEIIRRGAAKMAALREEFKRKKQNQERNGDQASG